MEANAKRDYRVAPPSPTTCIIDSCVRKVAQRLRRTCSLSAGIATNKSTRTPRARTLEVICYTDPNKETQMTNPFTAQLLKEITDAQLSCTSDTVDRKEMWILLDRIEQHLITLDANQKAIAGFLSKIGRVKVRVGNSVIPPALSSNGIMLVQYVESLDD